MKLTKKEKLLIQHVRLNVIDGRQCVVVVKYTPLGERGHTQSILTGTQMPLSGLRKSLSSLLKDIKILHKKGYSVFASYDPIIGSLSVFDMESASITVNDLTINNNDGI